MKRISILMVLSLTLSTMHATQNKGTVHVFQDNGLKIICQAHPTETNQPVDAYLTRKKNIASSIINGLAQACSSIVNIIASDSPQAKQQAILSVIGTVCNVTADLTSKDKSISQAQRDIRTKTLAHSFADLTTALLKAHEQDASTRKPLPQTLSLLKDIPEQSRASVIELMLSSSKNAYQLLFELFTLAQEYLSACFDTVVTAITEKLDNFDTSNDLPQLQALDLTIPEPHAPQS